MRAAGLRCPGAVESKRFAPGRASHSSRWARAPEPARQKAEGGRGAQKGPHGLRPRSCGRRALGECGLQGSGALVRSKANASPRGGPPTVRDGPARPSQPARKQKAVEGFKRLHMVLVPALVGGAPCGECGLQGIRCPGAVEGKRFAPGRASHSSRGARAPEPARQKAEGGRGIQKAPHGPCPRFCRRRAPRRMRAAGRPVPWCGRRQTLRPGAGLPQFEMGPRARAGPPESRRRSRGSKGATWSLSPLLWEARPAANAAPISSAGPDDGCTGTASRRRARSLRCRPRGRGRRLSSRRRGSGGR